MKLEDIKPTIEENPIVERAANPAVETEDDDLEDGVPTLKQLNVIKQADPALYRKIMSLN
jgi:hypothetical protein